MRLFSYGTLRVGQRNHQKYASGFLSVQQATVRGRVRRLRADIPILEVPHSDILAVGTIDAFADVRTQARLAAEMDGRPVPEVEGEWDAVPGDLFTYADVERRLLMLDDLEEFRGEMEGLYCRVLLRPMMGSVAIEPAWVYVSPMSIRNYF